MKLSHDSRGRFVVAAGMSFAFAECAGHTKAQLVQSDTRN
jgi:hypothetical protein